MLHAPRPRPLSCLLLIFALGCPKGSEGDDLPAGGFTSGPDDSGNVDSSDATTVVEPDETTTTTTTTGSSSEDSGSSEGIPRMVSHAEHILPIWSANCSTVDCHDAEGGPPQAGLDLASDGVLERLCEGDHNFSGMRYIDCEGYDPQLSYAFRKIENTHLEGISGGSGLPMPPIDMLTDDEVALIEAWITGGTLP
jgi:hypothetical protein